MGKVAHGVSRETDEVTARRKEFSSPQASLNPIPAILWHLQKSNAAVFISFAKRPLQVG